MATADVIDNRNLVTFPLLEYPELATFPRMVGFVATGFPKGRERDVSLDMTFGEYTNWAYRQEKLLDDDAWTPSVIADDLVRKVPVRFLAKKFDLTRNVVAAVQDAIADELSQFTADRPHELAGGTKRRYFFCDDRIADPEKVPKLVSVFLAIDPSLGEYEIKNPADAGDYGGL